MYSELENIYCLFISELFKITAANGYYHDIGSNIYIKHIDPADLPAASITLDKESTAERNEDDSVFTREAVLKLSVFFQTAADVSDEGLIAQEQMKWLWDIKRFISGHKTVKHYFNSSLNTAISHIWADSCIPDLDYKNNKGSLTVLIKIHYTEEFIN